MCNYKPDLILKIDEVWETKYKAFQILAAQKHLWHYYERVALNRGIQGARNTGIPMTYGEAYQTAVPPRRHRHARLSSEKTMKTVVVRNIQRADAMPVGVLGEPRRLDRRTKPMAASA